MKLSLSIYIVSNEESFILTNDDQTKDKKEIFQNSYFLIFCKIKIVFFHILIGYLFC